MINIMFTNKTEELVKAIIKTEDLDVRYKVVDTTLGDTVIECYGSREDLTTLEGVYEMVK